MVDAIEEGFLASLRARPADDATRLVYADWLEERGRDTESEFLRLQIELSAMGPDDPGFERAGNELREYAAMVEPAWRTIVARGAIEGCSIPFDIACPKQWDALAPTGLGDDVRFCGCCKQSVYYSATVDEAYEHARQGRCVVVDLVQLRRRGDLEPPNADAILVMGSFEPPED